MPITQLIIDEGGINWRWFTHLTFNSDKREVTIERFYRMHYEEWKAFPKAISHPSYYSCDIWREDANRVALAYNVPHIGWCKITNPKFIFDYK